MYKRVIVKVRRGFGENKKLNFIYMLIKFSFTRGLLSEGLVDTHSPAVFLSSRSFVSTETWVVLRRSHTL